MKDSEIILYEADNAVQIDVRLENDTVWLNRQQLSVLFNRDVKTIGKHINNALKEELVGIPTVAKFATVQIEGDRIVERLIEYYNIEVITSVGYRVKSPQGVKFRIWANRVLKDYLLKGYAVNNRLEKLEHRVKATEDKIDFFVKTALPPVQGIFFDGQIFDAYVFVNDLIKKAKKSIVLIDNYVDESVLLMLAKRSKNVKCEIYTQKISEQLKLDLQKHNSQYEAIAITQFKKSHDRFIILDNQDVYHIGASLKDLGKKWFAFSKMEVEADKILSELSK